MRLLNSSRGEHYAALLESAIKRVVDLSTDAKSIYANIEIYLNRLKTNQIIRDWSNLVVQHGFSLTTANTCDIAFDVNITGKTYPVSISC